MEKWSGAIAQQQMHLGDAVSGDRLARLKATREHPKVVFCGEHALARRLQSGEVVAPHGIAKVRLLLSDGTGPLFYRGSAMNLSDVIREATSALS